LRRQAEGIFYLSEHLRLAHDERVEPGGDAEQVLSRFRPDFGVKMGRELISRDAVEVGQKVMNRQLRRRRIVARNVQLHTVARGDNGCLVMRWRTGQGDESAIDTTSREVEPL